MEKECVLDQLCSDMTYGAVASEFNASDPIVWCTHKKEEDVC